MSPRCKRAKELDIDNCHEDYEDEEDYCLFHKPGKDEKEAKNFYTSIRKRCEVYEEENKSVFRTNLDFSGFFFPKTPEGLKPLFSESVFKERVVFGDATFEGLASFERAVFEKSAVFRKTEFNEPTDFNRAIFKGTAYFNNGDFIASCSFSKTKFEKFAKFIKTVFRSTSEFSRAVFNEKTSFEEADFHGTVFFNQVVCKELIDFKSAVFKKNSFFRNSRFKEITDFKKANFLSDADFANIIFERPSNFKEAKFKGKLNFQNTDFRQGISILRDPKKFPEDNFERAESKEEACRVQKISYDTEGRKEAADLMFVEEMRARRAQKPSIVRTLEWLFVDFTSEYGTQWKNVLELSSSTILISTAIYIFDGLINPSTGIFGLQNGATANPLNLSYYSIVAFTTLGFGDIYPVGIIARIISSIEALLGAFFVALFVVVLARKWMR